MLKNGVIEENFSGRREKNSTGQRVVVKWVEVAKGPVNTEKERRNYKKHVPKGLKRFIQSDLFYFLVSRRTISQPCSKIVLSTWWLLATCSSSALNIWLV